jgi:predicted nucleic acid-binding protein
MPSGADTIVCNTGPLIALAKLEGLPLLSRLFARVLVPEIVWRELTRSRGMPKIRDASIAYGLAVLGTGGLLLRAKRAGLIPQVRPLFQSLVLHGYYISESVVARICMEAGEMTIHSPRPPHRARPTVLYVP